MDKSYVLACFGMNRGYLDLLIDDVSDERFTQQPVGVKNHPAWHLGHLAQVADTFASMLGAKSSLGEDWKAKYGMGSEPTGRRSDYPSKAEMIRILDDRRSALAKAYERATASELDQPNTSGMLADVFPTVGRLMLFGMISHENMHLGQLAAWRSAAGMEQALAKVAKT